MISANTRRLFLALEGLRASGAPDTTEPRRVLEQAAVYALSVLVPALILWAPSVTLAVAASARPVAFGAGLVSSFAASITLRNITQRQIGYVRLLIAVLACLVLALTWWIVVWLLHPEIGTREQAPFLVLMAGVVLSLTHAIGSVLRRWRSRLMIGRRLASEAQRQRAFELYPKALAVEGYVDPFRVIEGLAAIQRTKRQDAARADSLLDLLRHEIQMAADPRYRLPMPLCLAVDLLVQELDWRQHANGWPCHVSADSPAGWPGDVFAVPALLSAAGMFAIEYGLHHGCSVITLRLVYREAAPRSLEIRTNIKGGDLWFALPSGSLADSAKSRLVECLGRLPGNGPVFETLQDAGGCLVLRLPVWPECRGSEVWDEVEEVLSLNAHRLESPDRADGATRTYCENDVIHKVQILKSPSPKPLSLLEEHNVLMRLNNIPGVPQVVGYRECGNFAILSCTRLRGIPVDEYLRAHNLERRVWFRCLAELSSLLVQVHRQGVVHRDLRPEHVLVDEEGNISLIDFDQAVAGVANPEAIDLHGEPAGIIYRTCVSVRTLISWLGLDPEYDQVRKELADVWQAAAGSNANSPGRQIAYYQWTFGDLELSGERDWLRRWLPIARALRPFIAGARVLDLGCNLGLVDVHCQLAGAERTVGVDLEADILEAARRLSRVAGVSAEFKQGDLANEDFVAGLRREHFDLAIALSVLHWLPDRTAITGLLREVPALLYEGHETPGQATSFLRDLGFSHIETIGYSERLRAVFLARRGPARDDHEL